MRTCYNCAAIIPTETTHFILNDEAYCTSCVEEKPYTAHTYYVGGEYMGNSDDGESTKVEDYEDECEEDEDDSQRS